MNETGHIAPASDDETLPAGRPRTTADLAEAKLRTALQQRSGYIVVTAESANAAESLFATVEPRLTTFRTVRASGRTLDPEAIVRALWRDGDPPFPARLAMRTLLDEARAAGQPVVVAVAQAELADSARLERVRLTLEAAPDAGEIVRIALLGGPALVELLRRPESRAVALRIGATVQVPAAAAEIGPPPVAPPRSRRGVGGLAIAGATVAALAGLALWTSRSGPPAPVTISRETEPPPAGPPPLVPAEATPGPAQEPAAPAATPEPAAPVPAPSPAVQSPAPAGAGAGEGDTPAAVVDAPTVATATAPTEPAAPPAAPEAVTAPAHDVPTDASSARSTRTALQVGAFVKPEGAEALRAKLAPQFPRVYVSPAARGGTTFHRVRVAGFRSAHDVTVAEAWLKAAGYPAARVRE